MAREGATMIKHPEIVQFVFLVVTWGFIFAFAACGLIAWFKEHR